MTEVKNFTTKATPVGTDLVAGMQTAKGVGDERLFTLASIMAELAASGDAARISGSTYSTIQHMQDVFHSAGITSWTGITDDADGTITVAGGTGLIRATDSDIVQLLFTDWAAEAGANVALVDNDMNYLYVEYNAGSPQIVATITPRTDTNTNIKLGTVYRAGTTLHITDSTKIIVIDHAAKMEMRMQDTMPFARVSGGIISEVGTRNIDITAGSWWEGLASFTTPALDTSVAGVFEYQYSNGAGGFTSVASSTQIDNLQYDDGSGTLATLSNSKYGVHWVYAAQDGDYYVLYGTVNDSLTAAQDAGEPASLPPYFAESHARLIGKIIIAKSASTFTSVQSAFNQTFSLSTASDHGGLVGLGDVADHPGYLTLAGDRVLLDTLKITEQAASAADVAGNGQLWVKSTTPNELWFTDDAGTDLQVSGVEVTGTSAQIVVYNGSNVATAVGMSGAVAISNTGATTIPITFDIQFSVDITAGAGDYVIHDDALFAYEIDSINACLLDVATSTATVTVKIGAVAVTGISVAATTTKQTVADASTAASSVVATNEVSITIASPVNSPTLLTGVLHCTRTLA